METLWLYGHNRTTRRRSIVATLCECGARLIEVELMHTLQSRPEVQEISPKPSTSSTRSTRNREARRREFLQWRVKLDFGAF